MLGSNEAPETPFICAGDRVKIVMDVDQLKAVQEKQFGKWKEDVPKVCIVHSSVCFVSFPSRNHLFNEAPSIDSPSSLELTKILRTSVSYV